MLGSLLHKQKNDLLDESAFESSLSSIEFKISAVTFLMNSIPIFLDLCMDLYSGVDEKLFHFTVGRSLITSAAILSGFQFATQSFSLYIFQVYSDKASSFLFSSGCFGIILCNSLLFCVCQANSKICTVTQTTAISILSSMTMVLRFYGLIVNNSLVRVSYLLDYILLFSVPLIFFYWLYHLFTYQKKWTTDSYSCFLYLTVLALFYIAGYFNVFAFSHERFGKSSNFKSNTSEIESIFFFSFIMILLAMVPARIAKIEALASKVNKLHLYTNDSFVRYSSKYIMLRSFIQFFYPRIS